MFNRNPNLKYRSLWLAVGYTLVAYVIYSSLTPNPIEMDVSNFDKYAHTFGYFVLMGWFMQIYHQKKSVIMLAVFFIFMGVALEYVQGMTGYRYFDFKDMLANGFGVVLAVMLIQTPFPQILWIFERKFLVKL